VAAEIRAIHPPDAYKGKGIRYAGEVVRLKPGKTGGGKKECSGRSTNHGEEDYCIKGSPCGNRAL